MAIQLASSSSSCTSKWSYDVFLSFRGTDTRNNFTSHLYSALHRKGVITFIDDEELKKGEKLSREFIEAIKESRISLVVFSKNYATSSWCLDELVQIIECKETEGQMVRPIFYDVNPSEVRYRKSCYAEAFAKHEQLNRYSKERIQRWKTALDKAADLSGWHLGDGSQSRFIERIVEEIWSKLNRVYLDVAEHPVGIEPRVQDVKFMLNNGLSNVHIVGIHGIGGIGKTTIAKALYNEIADKFEGCSFLENVRERSKQYQGVVELQETLLFEILGPKAVKIGSISRGINFIKERLCYKKVLLVIDDVDHLEQLTSLAGDKNWFGSGSRIIVTTRDEHLLVAYRVDCIYRVQELNNSDSLKLLYWNAFREHFPREGFLELSKNLINYTQLPLALIVLGSFLCGRSKEEWESTLNKLKNFPHKEIYEVLKISFDGLDDHEKAIFLDIACFFKGEDIDYVRKVLDSRDFYSEIGIKVLVERALLTIRFNRLWMHDLIQDMGKEIVRRESPGDPGQRSRLWFHEDILYVLTENAGTNSVKGIKLAPSEPKEVQLNSESFKTMKGLQLLIMQNTLCSGDLEYLPSGLRWLEWHGYPFSSFPDNFSPKKLIYFDMRGSMLKICHSISWFKDFKCLKYMNLKACEFLTEVPDVSGCYSLEELILENCKNLTKLHEFIGNLEKLLVLDLGYCSNLVSLPRSFKDFKPLKHMNLEACELLIEVPDVSGCCNLEHLILEGCKSLIKVHESVGNLGKLHALNLRFCSNLVSLPRSFKLKSLEFFWLDGCSSLKEFPEIIHNMDCLTTINLSRTGIEELPSSIERVTKLDYLNMSYCENLTKIPSCIYKLHNLRELLLDGCTKLGKFPMFSDKKRKLQSLNEGSSSTGSASSLNLFPSLCNLNLTNCNLSEVYFLRDTKHFPALKQLWLSENNITTIPALHQLPKLRSLDVRNCKLLQEIPELPANMCDIIASGCESLQRLSNGLQWLDFSGCPSNSPGDQSTNPHEDFKLHRKYLRLDGCLKLKEFPKIMDNLNCLEEMDLSKTEIEELPSSIEHITGLKYLYMSGCQNLTNISSCIYRLQNLTYLILDNCTKLRKFPKFTSLNEGLSSIGSTSDLNLFPSLETLTLRNCNLSEVNFLTNTEHFPALSDLCLNENNITTIPACLHKLAKLSYLHVSKCKLLQEIPMLPANMEKIEAHGCGSLQRYSQLESMLRGIGRKWIDFSDCHRLISTHGDHWMSILQPKGFVSKYRVNFLIPGSEIPEWFSHKSLESHISFRVPVNSSTNIIALAFGAVLRSTFLEINVFINGECKDSIMENLQHSMESDNLWLDYIPQIFLPGFREDYIDFEIKVSVDETSCLKAFGVHLMEGQYEEDTYEFEDMQRILCNRLHLLSSVSR